MTDPYRDLFLAAKRAYDLAESNRTEPVEAAAKVLREALEVTGEMLQVGNRVWLDGGNERAIYEAMIDHALASNTGEA